MKEKHIVEILESAPFASLNESDLITIRSHVEGCSACYRSYEAARLSALLIKERVAETVEPTPFFQTRVMAALREQQAIERVPAYARLWKSAGVLVSSMALTTAALAAFSFIAPGPSSPAFQETAAVSPYSAEAVVLDQSQNDDQMSDEQVLSTIYADDDEAR
jgi:hypothetical protein